MPFCHVRWVVFCVSVPLPQQQESHVLKTRDLHLNGDLRTWSAKLHLKRSTGDRLRIFLDHRLLLIDKLTKCIYNKHLLLRGEEEKWLIVEIIEGGVLHSSLKRVGRSMVKLLGRLDRYCWFYAVVKCRRNDSRSKLKQQILSSVPTKTPMTLQGHRGIVMITEAGASWLVCQFFSCHCFSTHNPIYLRRVGICFLQNGCDIFRVDRGHETHSVSSSRYPRVALYYGDDLQPTGESF